VDAGNRRNSEGGLNGPGAIACLSFPYTEAMFLLLLTAALSVWFLFWPEAASRVLVSLNRPFGRKVPLRPFFFRLVGLTWLLVLAWDTWTRGW
jgi:hypothetical protein